MIKDLFISVGVILFVGGIFVINAAPWISAGYFIYLLLKDNIGFWPMIFDSLELFFKIILGGLVSLLSGYLIGTIGEKI